MSLGDVVLLPKMSKNAVISRQGSCRTPVVSTAHSAISRRRNTPVDVWPNAARRYRQLQTLAPGRPKLGVRSLLLRRCSTQDDSFCKKGTRPLGQVHPDDRWGRRPTYSAC
jgi:hypothetical protein